MVTNQTNETLKKLEELGDKKNKNNESSRETQNSKRKQKKNKKSGHTGSKHQTINKKSHKSKSKSDKESKNNEDSNEIQNFKKSKKTRHGSNKPKTVSQKGHKNKTGHKKKSLNTKHNKNDAGNDSNEDSKLTDHKNKGRGKDGKKNKHGKKGKHITRRHKKERKTDSQSDDDIYESSEDYSVENSSGGKGNKKWHKSHKTTNKKSKDKLSKSKNKKESNYKYVNKWEEEHYVETDTEEYYTWITDHEIKYEEKYEFLLDLTFEEVVSSYKTEKFYDLFGYYPESESLFKFTKHCHKYSKKPNNYDVNFQYCINLYFSSDYLEVSDDLYKIYKKNLFSKEKYQNSAEYEFKHEFIMSVTYNSIKSSRTFKNMFYILFGYHCESKSVFDFTRYCHHYTEKPDNYDDNFVKSVRKVMQSSKHTISDSIYHFFNKKLFKSKHQVKILSSYQNRRQFIQSLTFKEAQKEENSKIFFNLFGLQLKSESIFNFIKNCHLFPKKPDNYYINFQNCIADIRDSNYKEVSKEYYKKFHESLYEESDVKYDEEATYEEKYTFIKRISYEEVLEKKNYIKFYKLFGFYPLSESLFKFTKHCHSSKKEPKTHKKYFLKLLKLFKKSNSIKVSESIFKEFDKYIKKVKSSYEDSDSDENTKKDDKDDQNNEDGKISKDDEDSGGKKGFIKFRDIKGWNSKHYAGKKNSQFYVWVNTHSVKYEEKYQFLKKLKFKEVKNSKMLKKFYKLFGFYPETESLFKFTKKCHTKSKKPKNYEVNFQNCLNIHFSSRKIEVSSNLYSKYEKNLNSDETYINNAEYLEKYYFLSNVDYEKVKSLDNYWNFYYILFGFYPETKEIFDFTRYCHHFKETPDNYWDNFIKSINIYINENNGEFTDKMYQTYNKNLFSSSKYSYSLDYEGRYRFIQNIQYKDVQSGENKDIFYFLFGFNVDSENIFNFVRYCHRFPKKPDNYYINFYYSIQLYISSKTTVVFKDLYERFNYNLFSGNQQNLDKSASYEEKRQFLARVTYSSIFQYDNYIKFYSYFGYYALSESIFTVTKYCFRYPYRPPNHEENYEIIVQEIINSESIEISKSVYSQYDYNLFPYNNPYDYEYSNGGFGSGFEIFENSGSDESNTGNSCGWWDWLFGNCDRIDDSSGNNNNENSWSSWGSWNSKTGSGSYADYEYDSSGSTYTYSSGNGNAYAYSSDNGGESSNSKTGNGGDQNSWGNNQNKNWWSWGSNGNEDNADASSNSYSYSSANSNSNGQYGDYANANSFPNGGSNSYASSSANSFGQSGDYANSYSSSNANSNGQQGDYGNAFSSSNGGGDSYSSSSANSYGQQGDYANAFSSSNGGGDSYSSSSANSYGQQGDYANAFSSSNGGGDSYSSSSANSYGQQGDNANAFSSSNGGGNSFSSSSANSNGQNVDYANGYSYSSGGGNSQSYSSSNTGNGEYTSWNSWS